MNRSIKTPHNTPKLDKYGKLWHVMRLSFLLFQVKNLENIKLTVFQSFCNQGKEIDIG